MAQLRVFRSWALLKPTWLWLAVILRCRLTPNQLQSYAKMFTFGVLRPGIEFRRNWHIEAMAYKLSQVARGDVKRLIITIPPRNLNLNLPMAPVLAKAFANPSDSPDPAHYAQ